MAISTYLSIITLNANRLNSLIKRHMKAEWITKRDPSTWCLHEIHFTWKDTQTESKGWIEIFHENGNKTKWKPGVAILTADKIDFKTNAIIRDKEGPINSTSAYVGKETQNTKSKRPIYPYVHCSIIYNSQDTEVI